MKKNKTSVSFFVYMQSEQQREDNISYTGIKADFSLLVVHSW